MIAAQGGRGAVVDVGDMEAAGDCCCCRSAGLLMLLLLLLLLLLLHVEAAVGGGCESTSPIIGLSLSRFSSPLLAFLSS